MASKRKMIGLLMLTALLGMLTLLSGIVTIPSFVLAVLFFSTTNKEWAICFFMLLTAGGAILTYQAGNGVKTCIKARNRLISDAAMVTANLPASESLVRASAEPMPEPATVLLRATQEQETPQEQLLRAAE